MTREERLENLREICGTNIYACMKCGKCSGRCPANVQPHAFVSRLVRGRLEELLADKGLGLPYLLCLRGALPPRRIARFGGGSGAENAGVHEREQPYRGGGNSARRGRTYPPAAVCFRIQEV